MDDCKIMDMDIRGAKVSGNIISAALDEMAVKALYRYRHEGLAIHLISDLSLKSQSDLN